MLFRIVRTGKFLVVFFTLLYNSVCGQSPNADTLINILNSHTKKDTARVNLLNKIAFDLYTSQIDKTKEYATESYNLAKELGYSKGEAESLWLQGITYINRDHEKALGFFEDALAIAQREGLKKEVGKYTHAIGTVFGQTGKDSIAVVYYIKAIDIAKQTNNSEELGKYLFNLSRTYNRMGKVQMAVEGFNQALIIFKSVDDKRNTALSYNSLGNIYTTQGNYPIALECFQNALKLSEEIADMNTVSKCLISLGSIYFAQKNYQQALEYNQKVIEIAQQNNDMHALAGSRHNIGLIYLQKDRQKALENFLQALEESKNLKIPNLRITILLSIGQLYLMESNFDQALEMFSEAHELSQSANIKISLCAAKFQIANIYNVKKDFSRALSYALSSLEIAKALKLIEFEKDLHKLLSEVYASKNNYKSAYHHSRLYKEFSDKIFNESNVKQITELEFTYKFEKEKQAIALEQHKKDVIDSARRKQQHAIILTLALSFILVSLLALYIHRLYRFKNQVNQLLTRQKDDIRQLNEELVVLNSELSRSNEQLSVANEMIQERERLLTQITDNIPAFISLIDSNMNYIFANNGYASLCGLDKSELIGKKIDDTEHIAQALNGTAVHFENHTDKDNQRTYIYTSCLPYYFNNNLRGVLICSFDITERKLAEQAMRNLELEKKRLLELEIARINIELEQNQKALTAASLKLIQNSERDVETVSRLEAVLKCATPEGQRVIHSLILDFKRISRSSNWNEFELLFQKVHNSFYQKLNESFPNLTANERKLCAFLKLNMSSKDIANITFQSEEALKKARQRLRQKLGIDRDTNLIVYLQNI